jgi:ElaB/YqjD/DUF883 family membrane-anchored ribosome-binding protein
MSEKIMDAGQEAAARMQGVASDTAERIQGTGRQLYSQASGQSQQAAGQLSNLVKEQPVSITLAALVIGYVLGRLTAD